MTDFDAEFSEETRRVTRRYKTFTAKLPLSELEQTEQNLKDLTPKPDAKYIHEGVIAYGGMKVISRLRDKDTLRDVAHATLLNPDADIMTVGRFLREARITANLEHPNIIPIHDIGIEGNIPYFTMKLIDGDTLQDIIEALRAKDPEYQKRFPLTELLRIYRQILNAVAFAHTKGVIHLDLSPGNVLVGKFGEVLVLDWGLSRVIGAEGSSGNDVRTRLGDTPNAQPSDGIAQGTLGYMAPEQAAGYNSKQDVRTDIYALGAILYTILTRVSAIPGKTMREVLTNTIDGHFKPPRDRVKHDVPISLNAVVMKAMSRHREERYQTVRELRSDIDAFLDGRATLAEKPTILKHTFLFLRRNWIASALSLLLILLLGSYGIYQVLNTYMAVWHWGEPVYVLDCRKDIRQGFDNLICTDSGNRVVQTPFLFSADGLIVPSGSTVWFPEMRPYTDARAVFKVRTETPSFDLFWGCSNVPVDSPLAAPPGTMIRFRDGMVSASNNRYSGLPIPFAAKNAVLPSGTDELTVTVLTINGLLSVSVNNTTLLRTYDPYPVPAGKAFIGVRAGEGVLYLSDFELSPPSPDANLGQFAIPEMLIWRGAADEAVKYYLTVARESSDETVARQACIRAMLLILYRIREFDDPEQRLDQVRDGLPDRFRQSLEDRYYAVKAEIKWRMGLFSDAFRILRLISDHKIRHNAARHLEGYGFAIPPETEELLNNFLNQTE